MIECPYCHEQDQEQLPMFHYSGLVGSTHIECQTCGQEFSRQEGEKAAAITAMVEQIKQEGGTQHAAS